MKTNQYPHKHQIAQAAELIAQADALIITAGAGMDIDSGLPDFRGNEGFWRAYPAFRASGQSFADVASPATFRQAPHRAWGFYGHRLQMYRNTLPHAGFGILQRWAQARPKGCFVYTSNVDGQFQKAGFAPESIMECHGSLYLLQCINNCSDTVWSAQGFEPHIDAHGHLCNAPPRCPHCGQLARPQVLMFNDEDWCDHPQQGQMHNMENFLTSVARPIVVEMGAGTHISTVRQWGQRIARLQGCPLIRINPDAPDLQDTPGVSLPMGALQALLQMDAALSSRP